MIVSPNKYYILYSYIYNNDDIYSPSMPYKWKWANGPNNKLLPLAIFDNLNEIDQLRNILSNTYPYKSKKANLIVKNHQPFYCINMAKLYNIKINIFYLQSFIITKDEGFKLNQINILFNNDTLS